MKKPSHLIINNPYRMPDRHWKYDRQQRELNKHVAGLEQGGQQPGRSFQQARVGDRAGLDGAQAAVSFSPSGVLDILVRHSEAEA